MGLHGKLLQIALAGVVIIATAVVAAAQAKPECQSKCGNVEIPYPFGLAEDCYLDEKFNITCDSGQPKVGNLNVTSISIETHELRVLHFVARDCYSQSGHLVEKNKPTLWAAQFTISNSKNQFTALGCDTYAYLRGTQKGEKYWTGCMSLCSSLRNVVNGSCSGVGCCEIEFPDGLRDIEVEVRSYYNHTNVSDFNSCGYAFVVEKSAFNFSSNYLTDLPSMAVPMVFDWAVGNETCEEAQNKSNFRCQRNSTCLDHKTGGGYRCMCNDGYQGNPYLFEGCKDIDECKQSTNNCTRPEICVNTEGNYTCKCPKGYHGDGTKDGTGCVADPTLVTEIAIVIGVVFVAMLVGSSWMYLIFKKRKLIKLKHKFFRQNGSLILEHQLREQAASTEVVKIFTLEELKKATKNYDESQIIGQGGFGTVYKGILPDNKIVAIKKSKIVDQCQVDQFINEVVVLSQINHRNVVKLLGCCLEIEVPSLVYEFVPRGTLFRYIHHESNASPIRWETRIRIAIEVAKALSYLHSAASTPIIHRDVKSANILLDDDFTAKVSDFGTLRLVPRDQKEIATMVQGTLGYLDLEYLQTNQLTEKSDVYSFGVVLVELLIGKAVLSFNRSDQERSLAMYFLSSLKEDQLFEVLENGIVEEGNEEQIKEVVKLAKRCLRVKGDERPTMKEVVVELEGIRKTETHPWVNAQSSLEEAEHLLSQTFDGYRYDGNSSRTARYDSMNNQVTTALGDGR